MDMKDKIKNIVEGAFYSAVAVFVGDISDGLESLDLSEPWEAVMVAVIGVLAWVRSELNAEAAKDHGKE